MRGQILTTIDGTGSFSLAATRVGIVIQLAADLLAKTSAAAEVAAERASAKSEDIKMLIRRMRKLSDLDLDEDENKNGNGDELDEEEEKKVGEAENLTLQEMEQLLISAEREVSERSEAKRASFEEDENASHC